MRALSRSFHDRTPTWNVVSCDARGPSELACGLSSSCRTITLRTMNNFFRGLFAGAAAWKWGGGLLSTILIFWLVWTLLGHC